MTVCNMQGIWQDYQIWQRLISFLQMLFDAETKDMAIWEYADRKSEEGARVEMSDGPSNQHKE